MNPYRIVSFVLSFVNVVLLIATHISHGWTLFYPKADIINSGLWITCSGKHGCYPMHSTDVYLDFTRCFMLLGVIASIIAMLWSVDWDHVIHCNFIFVPKALMTSIFSFLSGVFVLLAVAIFALKLDHKDVHASKKWGFYLSFPIFVLCILSGIYNLVTYKLALWGTGTSTTHVGPHLSSHEDLPHVLKASQPSFL
ncbi:hypothetical protein JD844_005704 [Phrynosoma platyrhinos]|uniref:Uncharacterized protein n=1 Tax=Phrynosoma platyrhinos TaxID=52577 RepID=A0ABQ7TP93_PHRPL|nr:hypothetical protein JD844_005704 [Phrynosoma platyrhinos]